MPGSYRQLQARLRTNAEPVAFYGGIEKEGNLIIGKFKELVRHHVKLLNTQWRFAMWQVTMQPNAYSPFSSLNSSASKFWHLSPQWHKGCCGILNIIV